MRRLLDIIVLFVILCAPSLASAETLSASIGRAFETDDAGLRLLKANGGLLGPVLTLERVPDGHFVVEVEITIEGRAMRYPLKMRHDGGEWAVDWQPVAAYAAALVGIAKSGALPQVAVTERWVGVARMPAMPVIATRKRFVTPFGEVAADDRGEEAPQGDLGISPGLTRATQSWINQVLADDPGPAGIDLILDSGLSWRLTNKLLFNTASLGLFEVTIVTADMGALRVASPARPARFVMAMSAIDTGFGLRAAMDGELAPGDGCAAEMTACVREVGELAAVVQRVAPTQGPLMFAAAGDVSAGDVVAFVAEFAALTNSPPHRLLVGYVQK